MYIIYANHFIHEINLAARVNLSVTTLDKN